MKKIIVYVLLMVALCFNSKIIRADISEVTTVQEEMTLQKETQTDKSIERSKHKIVFYNSINGKKKEVYVDDGSKVKEYIPKLKKKYTYQGWMEKDTGKIFSFNQIIEKDYELTMVYSVPMREGGKTFIIGLDWNYGGIFKTTQAFTMGNSATIDEPSDPSRVGYVFEGWYTKKHGGEKWDFKNNVISKGVCLYAHWKSLKNMRSDEYNKSPKTGYNMRTIIEIFLISLFVGMIASILIKKEK